MNYEVGDTFGPDKYVLDINSTYQIEKESKMEDVLYFSIGKKSGPWKGL